MELRDYLKVIRKHGWIIVAVAIITAAAAAGVSKLQTPVYRATIQMSLEPARLDYGLSGSIKDILQNYVVRLDSHKMAQKVIDRAQLDMTTDQLKQLVTLSSEPSTYTIGIAAKSTDPSVAMTVVQTMADLFVEERTAWNQEQDQRDRVAVTIVDNVRQADLFSPKTKTNAIAGFLFGAIVGALIVFVLEWLESDIVRTPSDVERFVGWTVLGTIPAQPGQHAGRRRRVLPSRGVPQSS